MSAVRWFVLILLVVLAAENVCGVNFLWTPTVFNDTGSTIADWNVAENWTPTGIPTTGDIAIFAATSNVSSISSIPVDIAGFRMDAGVNASFVSSFTVTGTVRLTDINATLIVFGDFSADTILMSIGTIETFTGFNVNGSFQWGAGAIFIRGEQATINSFIITGTTGLLVGDVIITSFGLFEDASRFFGPSNLTIGSEATLFLSLITLNLMQFTPEDESYIINRGNITVQSPLSDTLSTVRFGITPPSDASGYVGEPAVRMQNFGDILITGSGFLEVSTYDQGSGSLVLAGYRMNQLGLRTIPNAVSSINGGIISGNGWIDSDVVMSPGTALFLSATSNFTVTRISMLGDALLQITYFDPGLHGILFTASFNSRTIVGGALRLVFGNGPNALIVAGSGFQVVDRDVRARVGDLILLVAPIQFTNPIPAATFISAEVENNKFTIEQVGVQFAITQSIQFWNVTDVECDNDCSDNGVCVYPTFFTKPYCECDASDVSLHADCSVVDWTFLAWIIGPSLFGLLMLIEIMFCCFEGKYRKQILSDPTSINYLRPEISAFRAVHRHAPVRRVCFDLASLFLFTTEYEGSARSFDILSKILLSTGAVAVGLLAIIPFKGTSSTLQPIFTGINAGLTFTIAAVQVGWSSKKPRKIEFDVEVDDKKINLWAPFQKENLGWILRALPLEMNRLYTPPIPYTVQDFMFQDQTLDLSMQLREYFANYYRLPKVLCTRGISTNPVVNTAPATPQPLHVPPPASANPSPQNSPSSLRPPSSTLAPIIVPPVPPPPPGHTSSTAYLPLP